MTQNQETPFFQASTLPGHLLTRPAGAADPDEALRVTLRLIPRGGDEALFARIEELGKQVPAQRRYLDTQALEAEFGPSPDALDAVRAFCAEHGFTLDRTALGGLFATIVGKAGDLASAFGVELAMYHYEDRQFRAYHESLVLPAVLAPHVAAVLGIDEMSSLISRRSKTDDPCTLFFDTVQSNLPTVVTRSYYQYPAQFSGAGVTVAFMESDLQLNMENIRAFFAWLGHEDVKIERIEGLKTLEPPNSWSKLESTVDGEAMMDLKLVGAVAPDATLVVYGQSERYGYSSDRWIDSLMAALDKPAYPCHVMSISLGMPESNWVPQTAQSVHVLFGIACLMGITVCVSSGDFGAVGRDSGAYKQNCAFPATSPFCLACGGTMLELTAERELTGEVVWNELDNVYQKCATGGGLSALFPLPSYQQGLQMPTSFNGANVPAGRGIPDVAANAARSSGYALEAEGLGNVYGTSAAAPIWAALIALLVQGNGGKGLGHLNAWLYTGQIDNKAAYCKPITQGNNGAPGSNVVFSAEAGNPWNACCGLGSPLGTNIAKGLGIVISGSSMN